jgi:poly-gamma-glutamate capsule biosynthesis protein CapA/YwtB (metallophosphatase superfamily)
MARLARAALLLALAALVAAPAPARAQRADGLDQPLLAANQCGAADGSEAHFVIAATGDTFPHENIQAVGEAQGYDTLFDYVRPFLQAADLAYTNFDGAMLEGAGYTGYPNFNYNPALATALKNAGVDVVSTANNHIMDRGPEGLDATLRVLEANGILQHGTVSTGATERPPYTRLTLSRGGPAVTVGFVSATWGTNGIPDPYNQVNLLYESGEYGQQGGVRASVLEQIAAADRDNDLVMVAAHFGYEYQFYPDQSQIDAARRMAEAGADIILGAQSHTLQPPDVIDLGSRKTLVIYSLANFLASQGAFQAQYYSATSVIFYVGVARNAEGRARVTGYSYLPTIHVDNDTRPAPIPAGGEPDAVAHVRTIMRDPGGAKQLAPNAPPPGTFVEVCGPLTLAEAPNTPIPGDFAQHYRSLQYPIPVLGLPLGPVVAEPAGDCVTPVPVLYTERQRLELHADQLWPFRVSGTLLGAHAFAQRYPGVAAAPRTDLGAPDAFADTRFRAFFEQYGGLSAFGYPISGPLSEDNAETGAPTTVQYFERARFELAPGAPPESPLSDQVRLGLLGRELLDAGGAAVLCAGAAETAADATLTGAGVAQAGAAVSGTAADRDELAVVADALTQAADSSAWWIPTLAVVALLVAILALAAFAYSDWQTYRRRGGRRGYRRRRSAFERFGGEPEQPASRATGRTTAANRSAPPDTAPAAGMTAAERKAARQRAAQPYEAPPQPHEAPPQPYEEPPQPVPPPPQAAPPGRRPSDDDDELLRSLLGE